MLTQLSFAKRVRLALAITLVAIAVEAADVHATFPGENGRIAFAVTKLRWPPPETCTPDPHSCPEPITVSSAIKTVLPSGRGRRVLYPWPARGDARESVPAWSPSGSLLVFQPTVGGLAIIRRDGTGFRQLPQFTDADSEPTWSPDGRRLAFAGDRRCLYCRWLYTVRREGTGLHRVIAQNAYSPSWSVTGRIAFVNADDQYLKRSGIKDGLYTVKPDGTGLRLLYAGGYLGSGMTPDWSPDGRRIAFAAATREAPDNAEIFTVRADGRGLRQVTSFRSRDTASAPAWSPDGSYIAFLRKSGLYVMRPNGRAMRRLVATRPQDPNNPQHAWTWLSAPTWQPLSR